MRGELRAAREAHLRRQVSPVLLGRRWLPQVGLGADRREARLQVALQRLLIVRWVFGLAGSGVEGDELAHEADDLVASLPDGRYDPLFEG